MPAARATRSSRLGDAAKLLSGRVFGRSARHAARRGAVLGLAATVWLLLGPSTGATPTSAGSAKAANATKGGTVTFAEEPGSAPVYIFPLYPLADYSTNNTAFLQNLLYEPLYWFGKGDTLDINPTLSMASAPVYSDNDRTVTIHLKTGMEWSTGAPITSRDVEFWINMLEANKANYGPYVPGTFPTDLKSADYPNAQTVVLHLTASYNPEWFTGTALAEITPMPQQAWDKTSMSGKVGNDDTTTKGAEAVYKFLNSQSNTTAGYSSSPLWKVVDGPFRLVSNSSSGEFTFAPNSKYFGPKPHIAKLVELPYTSYAAENDALLTGGVDYGFISNTSIPEISRLKGEGYEIEPWPIWGVNYLYVNYTDPSAAPFMKQQYVRVAMQELINQPQLIDTIYGGYAYPTYGPVPTEPFTSYASPTEKKATYPYDPSKAIALLKSHGWKVVPTGQTTCADPSKCGPGITKGMPLSLIAIEPTGFPEIDKMMQAIQSSMSTAGIKWTLRGLTNNGIGAILAPCKAGSPCKWSLIDYETAYYWDPGTFPDGGPAFGTGIALYEGNAPYSATLDKLIQAIRTAPASQATSLLYKYEKYVEQVNPNLWIPNIYYEISVIKKNLHGALPQNPVAGDMTPQLWYLSGS